MSAFFDKLLGKSAADGVTVFDGGWDNVPEKLSDALQIILEFSMNAADGGTGVRDVGDKMKMLMKGIMIEAIDKRTGKSSGMKPLGDYQLTIERVA